MLRLAAGRLLDEDPYLRAEQHQKEQPGLRQKRIANVINVAAKLRLDDQRCGRRKQEADDNRDARVRLMPMNAGRNAKEAERCRRKPKQAPHIDETRFRQRGKKIGSAKGGEDAQRSKE